MFAKITSAAWNVRPPRLRDAYPEFLSTEDDSEDSEDDANDMESLSNDPSRRDADDGEED